METKATLKVVRARVECVLIYPYDRECNCLFVTMDTSWKLYFKSICTCSAQLSMFHTEKRSRNTLIIIIIKGTIFCSYVPAAA